MSFIYPRIISVVRPVVGNDMQYEQLVYEPVTDLNNLIASIQFKGITGTYNTSLPADASNETYWAIFVPFFPPNTIIADGLIQLRDVIIDDLTKRYEVVAPYWNSLGYNLRCKLLST